MCLPHRSSSQDNVIKRFPNTEVSENHSVKESSRASGLKRQLRERHTMQILDTPDAVVGQSDDMDRETADIKHADMRNEDFASLHERQEGGAAILPQPITMSFDEDEHLLLMSEDLALRQELCQLAILHKLAHRELHLSHDNHFIFQIGKAVVEIDVGAKEIRGSFDSPFAFGWTEDKLLVFEDSAEILLRLFGRFRLSHEEFLQITLRSDPSVFDCHRDWRHALAEQSKLRAVFEAKLADGIENMLRMIPSECCHSVGYSGTVRGQSCFRF